jgi:DNA-binding NarL/FixJ family response regulator
MYAPVRIVIADDHEIFRNGFKLLMKNQAKLELVGEAGDGRELLYVAAKEQPDIVIMDIQMPVMDGIEACKHIRKSYPHMQVIALSMFNDDNLIVDMLEAGAKGYLLKNTNREELLTAVTIVHEGGTYYCTATSNKLARLIADSKFNPGRSHTVVKISEREKQIIQLICEQYSNKEIASQLGLSIRTVESHRENIQEKLDVKNSVGIVIYAIRHKLWEM